MGRRGREAEKCTGDEVEEFEENMFPKMLCFFIIGGVVTGALTTTVGARASAASVGTVED